MATSENNKKRFLGKANVHNNHHMINMGNQRPKIGSKWPVLTCSAVKQLPMKVLINNQNNKRKKDGRLCDKRKNQVKEAKLTKPKLVR